MKRSIAFPIIAITASAAALGAGNSVADTDTVRTTRTLSEVVVTGSNDAVSRNLLPFTVSSVGATQLEATGSPQLLSSISGMVPGLFVSERNIMGFGISNGGSGGIKIRGVGGEPTNAVLMMVDGQPQFAGIYSHHVADFYQAEYVDHVEVLRGPASVLYGSNAMGGVINVITKSARKNGAETSITSQFGSYNTWQSSLTNTLRYGRFSSLVTLSYDRSDGVRKNFDFRQSALYAKAAYELSGNWKLQADYSLMQFIGNDPVYPTLSNPESTDIYHQNVIRGETSLTATNRYGATAGLVRVYYSYGNHYVDDPRHFHSLDDRLGVIAYQNFHPWKGADATLGFDFDRYTGSIPVSGGNAHKPGSLTTMERQAITEYSPYLTLQQALAGDRLILNAGLRAACSDKFGTEWVPQAGVAVNLPRDWHLKASVAKGYRNPSFRELYLYRTANASLHPERMMNYEVSAGRSFGRWASLEITAFYSRGSEMIQTVDMHNVNTGRFINKGVELSASSHPIDCLRLWATYSYLHSSLKGLTGAPRNQYYLGASWHTPVKGLTLDAVLKGVEGLYVADTTPRQSWATLSVRPVWRPVRWLQLFANFDNITDAHRIINRGYPLPGFTATGGFKITI